MPLKKQSRIYAEEASRESAKFQRTKRDWRDEAIEEDVEEPLFEAAQARNDSRKDSKLAFEPEVDIRQGAGTDEEKVESPNRRAAEPPPLVRDKKGRFVKTKSADDEITPPSFAEDREGDRKVRRREDRKFGKAGLEEDADNRRGTDLNWRGEERRGSEDRNRYGRAELRADRKGEAPAVVDADFEDIDAPRADYIDDPLSKGFGRKIREDRRRQSALARLEDLEPVAERIFNEEFFAALRVQPKELERAIRKARRRAEAREKNRLTPLRAIGWSAWVGVIAASVFIGYSYRNNIVAMFPNAKTAYDAVGIEANPYGLKIEGVTHRVAMSPQGPVIEILGRLRNDEKADVVPPMLQAEALGADGNVLSRWTFAARAEKVRAGEFADFSTRAPAPDGVNEVLLSFAPAEGIKLSVGDILKPQSN